MVSRDGRKTACVEPIPEDVRHQFETWARPKWRHREDFDQRIGAPRGTYNNIEVQAAWEAWQALTAAQQQGQAVAWVPVHPKQGPLWSMATDKPDRERLPSYPLRPLIYGDEPKPTQQGGGEVAMEAWNAALNDAGELRSNAPDERYERRAQNVEAWIKANRTAPPSAPVGVEEVAENSARAMYESWVDSQDIHCNRFPAWHELPEARRAEWFNRVVEADTGVPEADNLIGRLMHADPTFEDCADAAALIRKLALAQQPAACDMGELCIGCEPRNPDGSCPDKQPGAVDEKYAELIYAVARKYPGESRHETALRYIRQAESADHGPAQVAAQHQEPTT